MGEYGRDFTVEEMTLLRALIAADPQPTRAAFSREFCRRIGWSKSDGGLKDMMARVTMLAMHRDGVIVLPPPKGRQYRPKPIVFGPDTEPPLFPPPTTLDEARPLEMRPVVRGTREGRLWNEFVARYHYLGYKTLVGAQMRYAVHDRNGWPVAMLGFSTAAWKLAPRDSFIGWTPELREKNLPLVVDNPRFLILPCLANESVKESASRVSESIAIQVSWKRVLRWNCAPTRNRKGGCARQCPTRQAVLGIGDFLHPATLRRHQQQVTLGACCLKPYRGKTRRAVF